VSAPAALPTTADKWFQSPARQRWLLLLLIAACLLPFLHKAFNIDDPLFLWAAKHIVQHPLDPYGFPVVWYRTSMPMSEVMKNPPLASYFLALIGFWAGWSEPVLHSLFLLPAVAVILAIHQVAREMTRSPLTAAIATLATPVFLISATSVMCDVPMLALWLFAIILWRKGIREEKWIWLASAAVLIGICSLTKYFGVCLIPLLLLYSIWNKRRLGLWSLYFLIPVAMLTAYQLWTGSLYENGLLSGLTDYVSEARSDHAASPPANFLVGMSFTGGCALPALLLIPWVWSRRWAIAASVFSVLATAAIVFSWVGTETPFPHNHEVLLAIQLTLFLLGAVSIFSLAITDFRRNMDSDSVLLLAWVTGTFLFAAFLNWTVNGRSVLPMIPAVALLLTRRAHQVQTGKSTYAIPAALTLSLVFSLWITVGDTELANSARKAATDIHTRAAREGKRALFTGHWGFQYYMQSLGGVPVDPLQVEPTILDIVVIPRNNSNADIGLHTSEPDGRITTKMHANVTTMGFDVGAGFYSSIWGQLPFAFAPVPDETYDLVPLREVTQESQGH
jgi:4-amino-4-deoxy-L-arabinose transferase-like glycosyltransferase